MRTTGTATLALIGMVIIGLGGFVSSLQAEEVKMLRGTPSKEQILEVLGPRSGSSGLRTRGLSLGSPAAPETPPSPRKLDLEILFDFDSDRLTEQGRDVLDQLGAALNAEEMRAVRKVMLEGHTDARGSDTYNLDLSTRRARSVRDYLASQHGVARNRQLSVVGKGARELANPQAPEDAVNRRVRIIVDE